MHRLWVWLLASCTVLAVARCLPTSPAEVTKDGEQTARAKPKRAQEMLMFGNQQQNRQPQESSDPSASRSSSSTADEGSSSVVAAITSGLGEPKTSLAEEEGSSHSGHRVANELGPFSPCDADDNYNYDKTSANELTDDRSPPLPRTWDVPPYSHYHDDVGENRRKRSGKSTVYRREAAKPSIGSRRYPSYPTATLLQSAQFQSKRSVPIYQEPRFKRELDIDPEDLWTLLSLWENQRHKRNCHKNMDEEYENAVTDDDEGDLLQEGDARNVISWGDSPTYLPRRYNVQALLSSSDIGIVRTRPSGYYYDRYDNGGEGVDDGNNDEGEDYNDNLQYGRQRYDASKYADALYGFVHPHQRTYYETPAKRLTLSRKRSQIYDPYAGGSIQSQANPRSRGHLYQHRSVY